MPSLSLVPPYVLTCTKLILETKELYDNVSFQRKKNTDRRNEAKTSTLVSTKIAFARYSYVVYSV